jgi:two-component system NtrC family sensor kinase
VVEEEGMDMRVRILCVDDEINVLKALERVFMDEEYELITATSAEEGLAALNNGLNPQVILSDYRMPGLNGVDFLREVCKKWPQTVRLVLSGYADTAAVVAAINEGQIYKFIPKPWNDDELKVTIGNALERYWLHQKNVELTEALRDTNDELERQNEMLEEAVAQRTSDLVFRNRALTLAHNILDALPVAVVGVDPEGMVVQCNRLAEVLFGLDPGDAISRQITDFLPLKLNGSDCSDLKSVEVTIGMKTYRMFCSRLEHESQQGQVIVVVPEVSNA